MYATPIETITFLFFISYNLYGIYIHQLCLGQQLRARSAEESCVSALRVRVCGEGRSSFNIPPPFFPSPMLIILLLVLYDVLCVAKYQICSAFSCFNVWRYF